MTDRREGSARVACLDPAGIRADTWWADGADEPRWRVAVWEDGRLVADEWRIDHHIEEARQGRRAVRDGWGFDGDFPALLPLPVLARLAKICEQGPGDGPVVRDAIRAIWPAAARIACRIKEHEMTMRFSVCTDGGWREFEGAYDYNAGAWTITFPGLPPFVFHGAGPNGYGVKDIAEPVIRHLLAGGTLPFQPYHDVVLVPSESGA